MPRTVTVACFGEALWDILPRGIFPGGAPLNVAYHLARHGMRARLITAVGRDFFGDELRRRAAGWGLDIDQVARVRDLPTGVVRGELDAAGRATFRIERRAAWRRIPVPPKLLAAPAPRAIVFGTLALHRWENREALARLVVAWPRAWRVLDLNLRPPFDSLDSISFALLTAQFVKLNHEELALVAEGPVRTASMIRRAARRFAERYGQHRVCVTAGPMGAGLLWDGSWSWEPAQPVEVRDTVGAGDAFLGALLAALLRHGATPAQALARACRVAEFVAARDGATPPYAIDARGRPRSTRVTT